ncbi:hypothetical protein HJ526_00715 [Donghicola sp. C2-DW-16]|uniref:Uncharacterized protein n=1 Tax=Donghicola mangrovi TaxID=2729614 RepID=A0ABX2PA87_9RHOB|nr:hypothetical protein [Donghicola mangrovi]NVO25927.1 hypothetical protein [Donghicola mangrovi]
MKKFITLTAAFALAASTSTAVLAQAEAGSTGVGGATAGMTNVVFAANGAIIAATVAGVVLTGVALRNYLASLDKDDNNGSNSTTTSTLN